MILKQQRLILILSVLLVTGFVATSLASFFVSRASLREQISQSTLPLTSDNIYSEVQRDLLVPVQISSLMATDTFVRDWVLAGERNTSQIINYLDDIQVRYGTFTSFFVSEKTRNYYQAEGILKRVDPDEPRDEWYFRVRKMEGDFEINVDRDMAHQDAMTIFVNYRVFDYEGTYIGATGVGLAMTAVIRLIENYQEKYGRIIYFVDSQGTITLHGSSFPQDVTGIRQIPGMDEVFDKVVTAESRSLTCRRGGHTIYLNTRFIPEFDWYLIVEQSDVAMMRGILKTLFLNLSICLFITLIVLTVTGVTVSTYQKRMDELATTDKLTRVHNRLAFDIILDQTIRDSRRSSAPFSIVWFDVDYFKDVNDRYGHLAGDAVLPEIARQCRANLRESDVLSRWGGDEFIILLKQCVLADACVMAEKIRDVIGSTPARFEGHDITVTISLGVAEYQAIEDKTLFLRRADRALYRAKQNGRNRTEQAAQPEEPQGGGDAAGGERTKG